MNSCLPKPISEVFTTVLVQDGEPIWLPQHLARLHRHAQEAGLKLPQPLSLKFDAGTYLLRIAINSQGYEIKTRPWVPAPMSACVNGVSVIISEQIAPSQLKTSYREPYDKAYAQAQAHGAFEGLLCSSDGYLVDGSRTSLFTVQDQTITLLEGGIDGITRRQFALKAESFGYKIQKAYLKPNELKGELWLAGTSIGLVRSLLTQSAI